MSAPAEKWGDFHLRDQVGHVTVSTLWDGSARLGGPFETMVFNLGADENPSIRNRTRTAAATRHTAILAALGRLQRLGVL